MKVKSLVLFQQSIYTSTPWTRYLPKCQSVANQTTTVQHGCKLGINNVNNLASCWKISHMNNYLQNTLPFLFQRSLTWSYFHESHRTKLYGSMRPISNRKEDGSREPESQFGFLEMSPGPFPSQSDRNLDPVYAKEAKKPVLKYTQVVHLCRGVSVIKGADRELFRKKVNHLVTQWRL